MSELVLDSNIKKAVREASAIRPIGNSMQDSLENLVANLGTSCDKRSHSKFVQKRFITFDALQLLAMYHEDWATKKIIKTLANDMTREWRTFSDENKPETVKQIVKEEQRLGVQKKVNRALRWAKLFGGAAMYLGIEGTGELWEPLDLNRVREGSLEVINVVERPLAHISPDTNTFLNMFNPTADEYGDPEFFTFANGQFRVHKSRVIIFHGEPAPRFNTTFDNFFWGTSLISGVYNAIVNSQSVQDTVSSLVLEANVDIISVKDLATNLASTKGTEKITKRFQNANLIKSFANMLVIDQQEEYNRKSINFAQLPDLIDKFVRILSAATEIPAAEFLGESASGLSDTGQTDTKRYENKIRRDQQDEMTDQLNKLDEVLVRSAIGTIPDALTWEFDPLSTMDQDQQADIEQKNSQRDIAYFDRGIISAENIARNLQKQKIYEISDDDIAAMVEETAFAPDPQDINRDDTRAKPDTGGDNGSDSGADEGKELPEE